MLNRAMRRLAFITVLSIGLLIIYHWQYTDEYEGTENGDGERRNTIHEAGMFHRHLLPKPLVDRLGYVSYPPHRKLSNSVIETNMKGRHPILDLIEKGEKTWADRVNRQSKTLDAAVIEYKRRYHRPPPKGFDDWWRFAKEHQVILVDEFDQINHNIEPYFALSPETFRTRLEEVASHLPFSFHLSVKNGKVKVTGERSSLSRAQDIKRLIEPFAAWLPDLTMHASDHDKGNIILGQDQYDMALELVNEGSYFTKAQLRHYENRNRNSHSGLRSACHPTSNAMMNPAPETNSSHNFLSDLQGSMNYCSDPSLIKLHGTWGFDHTHETRLIPMWVHCKWEQDNSFLMPAVPGFNDIIRDPSKLVPWSGRRDSRLFWRARATGVDFHTGWNWRAAHRVRLHLHATNTDGEVELLQEYYDPDTFADNMMDQVLPKLSSKFSKYNQKRPRLILKSYSRAEVAEKYLDVGLVGPLVQCNESPPFCDDVAREIGFLNVVAQSKGQDVKYVVDIDGNGWSQRFGRLLSTGSVVFKSTVFPEWNTNWLVPYYHYIPLKVDYSDLYDTMAFFVGWPDGTAGHDDLAEKIAMNSVKFVRDCWRWEDMQAYMFRLLLEYARLASPDRDGASYHED